MFNKKENEMSDGQIFRNGKSGLKGEIEGEGCFRLVRAHRAVGTTRIVEREVERT